jgi:hypothetical protein
MSATDGVVVVAFVSVVGLVVVVVALESVVGLVVVVAELVDEVDNSKELSTISLIIGDCLRFR